MGHRSYAITYTGSSSRGAVLSGTEEELWLAEMLENLVGYGNLHNNIELH